MKRRILWGTAVASLILVACSGGTPSTGDARDYFEERLHAEVNGKGRVTDFDKTDGLKSIKDGVDTYELEFVAKTDLPGGLAEKDTYRGKVIFIRTENGWKATGVTAASDAESAARQKQENEQAIRSRVKLDMEVLETALNLYKLDNLNYPTNAQGLRALIEQPTTEPLPRFWKPDGYAKPRHLKDPWGNDYHYKVPGAHGEFDVYTLGADNKPDGEGLAADVGNW